MPTVKCILAGIAHRLDYNRLKRRDETIVNGILYLHAPFEFSYTINKMGKINFRPNKTGQFRIKSILRAIGD
jgi:hypothetical protein